MSTRRCGDEPVAAGIIDRRAFLRRGAAGAAAIAVGARPSIGDAGAQPTRPNLLFILADDLGYADLSAFGRTDYRTPNIDALVAEGVRFTNAYAAASTCTPTRVAFMTGRYPQRFDPSLQRPIPWGGGVGAPRPRHGLSPALHTFPERVRRAGYHTALIGKWHLGFPLEFSPLRHGFDEFYGIRGGGADYFTHTGRDGAPDLWDRDVPAEQVGYLTDLLTDRAIEYVTRRHDAPFYLSLHYNAPHWPWEGPADTHGANPPHHFSDGGSTAIFAEMMRSLDDNIGRLMAALARAGRERDTLVVFASDNGGERYSHNAPWSNGKFTLWEGGIRIPLAMRWTGRLPRGTSSAQPAISMDWTATLLAAAGAAADPASPLDGIDLLPFALGRAPSLDRPLFWRQPDPVAAPQSAARRGRWKYLRIGAREHLFDLAADPGERTDLSARSPDVLASLRDAWHAWNAEMVPVPPAPAATRPPAPA
jgi:arylsulfatase A-like enzyme